MDTMAAVRPITMHRPKAAAERVGELFDRHRRTLFRLAVRMTGDREAALDLVQEAFLRAARRPAAVPEGESAEEAWLVRVTVNLCRDRFRRRAVRERELPEASQPASESGSPESVAVARASVQRALTTLPAKRRAIVVLRELEGLEVDRIARLLRCRPATVRWHLSKGRRELALALDRKDAR